MRLTHADGTFSLIVTPGKLTAALMNYGLIATLDVFGGPWVLDFTWRFALAFGCALNILTIYFRW